jgi:hypothetical protein
MMAEYSYDQFLAVHEPQLLTSAVPEQYWKQLYQKLKNAVSIFNLSYQTTSF